LDTPILRPLRSMQKSYKKRYVLICKN